MHFKSERVTRSATIRLDGCIEDVFPLFGPVREKDWADGWDPEIIFSETDLVEQHMVFRTRAPNADERYFRWVITRYFPEQHSIEYTVSTENRVWFINVKCSQNSSETLATISYTYIGLTPEGNLLNREALQKMYALDMKDWEESINYYLKYGTCLTR